MPEDSVAFGDAAAQWERDAQEMRDLIDMAGHTQASAAAVLGFTDRAMRSYVSGREQVPPAVLYAMRWVAKHMRNKTRYLQVHWKRAGVSVQRGDTFELQMDGPEITFLVNDEVKVRGKLNDLAEAGIVSIWNTYSSDRFAVKLALREAETSDEPAELAETVGRLGFRLNTQLRKNGNDLIGPPSVEIFGSDGRSRLSPVLMTWSEIDHAVDALVRNARALGENAKRAMADTGAS